MKSKFLVSVLFNFAYAMENQQTNNYEKILDNGLKIIVKVIKVYVHTIPKIWIVTHILSPLICITNLFFV